MNKIRYYLEKGGISQRYLALQIGVDPHTMSRYVHDSQVPRLDTAYAMCTVLGVRIEDLFPEYHTESRCAGCADSGQYENAMPCIGCSRRYPDSWRRPVDDK